MPHQFFVKGRDDGRPADLFVATTSGSSPKPNYVAAWDETRKELAARGVVVDYLLHSGDCHVDDARNICARLFLASGAPKLLFIDDDVGWDAGEFIKFIGHDKDVVAAIYPKKADNLEFPVMTFPGRLEPSDDGKLIRVRAVPTGFLMLSRIAVEKLAADSVQYFQERDDEVKTPLIFERGVVNGKRWSGDFYFSRKWASLGGDLWVDPEMEMNHAGIKVWTGHLGDHWRRQNGIVDALLDTAWKRIQQGEAASGLFDIIEAKSGNHPWCAPARMIEACYHLAKATKGPVFEAGTGLTTIAMAMAGAEVHSLEHDVAWFRQMREWVKRYRLRSARLYYAPLRFQPDDSAWYEVPRELPAKFSLAVVDGPPRNLGDRKALWRNLGDRIADADWVVDDVDSDARTIAFLEQYGRKAEINGRFAVLRRTAPIGELPQDKGA